MVGSPGFGSSFGCARKYAMHWASSSSANLSPLGCRSWGRFESARAATPERCEGKSHSVSGGTGSRTCFWSMPQNSYGAPPSKKGCSPTSISHIIMPSA